MSDRAAVHVQKPPAVSLSSAPSRLLQRCGQDGGRDCACHDEDHLTVQLARSAVTATAPTNIPPIVHEVLRSPGQPLDMRTRQHMESAFQHDFSSVRLHTDPRAAESADAVDSLAYTVGNHIVLGAQQHTPRTTHGNRILAHELTHVVQQRGGAAALQSRLRIAPAGSQAEREADRIADRVARGEHVGVDERASDSVMHRLPKLMCGDLMSSSDAARVRGIGNPAHDAIENYFRGQVGNRFWKQSIPGASTTPFRTEDPDERRRRSATGTEAVRPQVIGGRAGPGTPDLGYRAGPSATPIPLQIAEVKPAILSYGPTGGLIEGELGLANYVLKGNSPENSAWRAQRRISTVLPMSPDIVKWPPSLETSSGHRISASFCLPGLIGYRVLTEEETQTILCTVSDKGLIDQFINSATNKAEGMVDDYIDKYIDPLITKKIQTLGLHEAINLGVKHARPAIQRLLTNQLGTPAFAVDVLLSDEKLVDSVAAFIEQVVGEEALPLLRQLVLQAKDALFREARRTLKQQIHTYLQEAFAALCAAAAVGASVSIADLLKKFGKDLGGRFGEAVVAVARQWAAEVAKIALTILLVLLAIVAIVVIIFVLPEILAALAAAATYLGGLAIAAGGAIVALGPRLMPLIDEAVEFFLRLAPALQGAPG